MKKEIESYDPDIVIENSKPSKHCICPKCGHETMKRRGFPCDNLECPICEKNLVLKQK